MLDAWEHGAQLTVSRNPHYWGREPPFDRITFKFVKNPDVQRDLLVRGDAHIAANLTPDLAAEVQKNANIDVLNVPSLGFPWRGLHVNRNPALKNPKTWEAIKYAIDYDGLAKVYLGGGRYPSRPAFRPGCRMRFRSRSGSRPIRRVPRPRSRRRVIRTDLPST